MKDLLIVVDPQYDFMSGSLKVEGAEDAIDSLSKDIQSGRFSYSTDLLVTLDWHPSNHCSFKEQGGPWPIHCVQHSLGAAIWTNLLYCFDKFNNVSIETKGTHPDRDQYSFLSEINKDIISTYLNTMFSKYSTIYLCGIAGDFCVLNTLKDLEPIWSKVIVLKDYTASIDGGEILSTYCENNKIKMV